MLSFSHVSVKTNTLSMDRIHDNDVVEISLKALKDTIERVLEFLSQETIVGSSRLKQFDLKIT